MSHKKPVKFTFKSLIRLIVFGVVVFLIISLVSGQSISFGQKNPEILGKTVEVSHNLYQMIPESSRQKLENINQSATAIFFQNKINQIKEATKEFPQKQIKEIQKAIIKNIYENTIKNIDSN